MKNFGLSLLYGGLLTLITTFAFFVYSPAQFIPIFSTSIQGSITIFLTVWICLAVAIPLGSHIPRIFPKNDNQFKDFIILNFEMFLVATFFLLIVIFLTFLFGMSLINPGAAWLAAFVISWGHRSCVNGYFNQKK